MYTHNQAHCKPITIYGFHCTQGALQMASNILSPNYTTQWNTLNEVSVYTQHSAAQSAGSGYLYLLQHYCIHSTLRLSMMTN